MIIIREEEFGLRKRTPKRRIAVTEKRAKTAEQELTLICLARRESIQDLENHWPKLGGSEGLVHKLKPLFTAYPKKRTL